MKPILRCFLDPCQSGYVRDCSDAHLLVHETVANAKAEGRCVWSVAADISKAFPRTWRQCFLDNLIHGVQVRGGCAHAVASILEWDDVLVTYGGCSVVRVNQGIPEGGKLGPFGFPVVPDSLAKALRAHKHGIGQQINVPLCWRAFKWQGLGCPIPDLVVKLEVQ